MWSAWQLISNKQACHSDLLIPRVSADSHNYSGIKVAPSPAIAEPAVHLVEVQSQKLDTLKQSPGLEI